MPIQPKSAGFDLHRKPDVFCVWSFKQSQKPTTLNGMACMEEPALLCSLAQVLSADGIWL